METSEPKGAVDRRSCAQGMNFNKHETRTRQHSINICQSLLVLGTSYARQNIRLMGS